MNKVKTFCLFSLIGLLPTTLFSQTTPNEFDCYADSIKNDENVFTEIQVNASFKGGTRAFQSFLVQHIDHSKFINELSAVRPLYIDSASVKFIISKKAVMSNLQIRAARKDDFQMEIERVIKKSSCLWEPGNYSGRFVSGWYQYDIFYLIELKGGELDIRVSFKPI